MNNRSDISTLHSSLVVDVMQAGTWQWNLVTNETVYNERWANIIGYSLEEISPTTVDTWLAHAHPDDLITSNIEVDKVKRGEIQHYSLEVRMRHKDGHYVWVLDSGKIVSWNEDGTPLMMVGTHIDITDRKNEQIRAEANENFLVQILNNTQDIIYRLSISGSFTFLSQAWNSSLGQNIEKAIGQSFRHYIHPDDLPKVNSFFDILRESKAPNSISGFRLLEGDGSWCYYETSANAIFEKGQVVGYAGIARDISKLYQAAEEVLSQKNELERFFTVSLDLLAIVDDQGHFYRLNKAWERTLGFSLDYLKSKPLYDFILPEDVPSTIAAIEKMNITGVGVNEFVNHYRCFDGSYRILEWKAQPHGKYIYASARDITDATSTQVELAKEKDYLRTTLLSVGDGVIATDIQGKISVINQVAQTLTGFSGKEAINQDLDRIFKITDQKTHRRIHNLALQVIAKAEPMMLKDVCLTSRDNRLIPIEDSASPIIGKDGKVQGAVIVFRDVTETLDRQKKIEYLSYHDQLTDCFNRHYYEKVIKDINKIGNYPLAIISIDLNNLKLINDTYGHETGDATIHLAAEIIRNNMPTSEYFFRMGGDEFLIFLPRTSEEACLAVREKIKANIVQLGEKGKHLSLAYGYHVAVEPVKQIQKVIKIADNYMYQNKIKNRP